MKTAFRDRVAAYFKAHPNTNVSNWTLMELGGSMAWRTRVSECRTQLGMNIPAPTITQDKTTGAKTSWYRFEPKRPAAVNLIELMEQSA